MALFSTLNGFYSGGGGIRPLVAVYNLSGSTSRVFLSPDDGVTWSEGSAPTDIEDGRLQYGGGRFLLWDISDGTIGVEYSDDNGSTWSVGGIPSVTNAFRDIVYVDGDFIGCDTVNGTVAISTDSGLTWGTPIATGLSFIAEMVSDGENIVAFETSGNDIIGIRYSDDGGTTWNAATVPSGTQINGASAAIGYNGTFLATFNQSTNQIIESSDGGATWTVRSVAGDLSANHSYLPVGSQFIAISGDKDDDNSISDDGISWSSLSNAGVNPNSQRATCSYGKKVFTVGTSGTVSKECSVSLDAGQSWSTYNVWAGVSGQNWIGEALCTTVPNRNKNS